MPETPLERFSQSDIIDSAELAKWLRVPLSWVAEKTRPRCKDRIPVLKIGRYNRYSRRQILEWLAATASQTPKGRRAA